MAAEFDSKIVISTINVVLPDGWHPWQTKTAALSDQSSAEDSDSANGEQMCCASQTPDLETLIVNAAHTLTPGAYLIQIHTFPQSSYCKLTASRVNPHVEMPCYYSSYLAVEPIKALVRTYSEVPEEALFINVHQLNEISMAREIATLQRVIKLIDSWSDIAHIQSLDIFKDLINQLRGGLRVRTETNYLLMHMTPSTFLGPNGFRKHLGTASGI